MMPEFQPYHSAAPYWRLLAGWLCLCILCLSSLFSTAFANPVSGNECTFTSQRIETAKGDAAQPMQRPAQGWTAIAKLPDQWNRRWPDYDGIAWYKVTFNYDCPVHALKQPLALAIEGITQSGRVYINQDLLWEDQIADGHSSRSQHIPRMWNVPASSLNPGENTIWVQVYGSITQKSGIGKLKAGSYDAVVKDFNAWRLEKRTLVELNTMINFVVSIFYFLAWLAIRNEKAFFWMAIAGFLWVLYSTVIIYTEQIPWLSTLQLDRLQNIIFCFYTVFGCLGAWNFAQQPFPRLQKILLSIAAVSALCIAFAPVQYLNQTIQIAFSFFILVFAAKCATYPYLAYKAKTPETYMLAALYIIYLPIAIHDAHFMITMEGHPWSPYTGPLTTLTLGGVLATRLARHTRQIKRFNKTLTEKVHQAEQDLTQSLGHQHQLALENALLQERIHLSHDLHDGLGGSIVRSILTLENNDKIEKAQVMSILKMLRSDLRQVIDSGSSLSANVPGTPVEWGAPIRHRFVQLFEEIDIRSKWHFDGAWKIKPSALQCITLTRVAEEALTNILKHSSANEVKVTLFDDENGMMTLHIQDNGIGFDPSAVDSGLHVGLHSMQTRIQRLSGRFTIHSVHGQTLLDIRLPYSAKTEPAGNSAA